MRRHRHDGIGFRKSSRNYWVRSEIKCDRSEQFTHVLFGWKQSESSQDFRPYGVRPSLDLFDPERAWVSRSERSVKFQDVPIGQLTHHALKSPQITTTLNPSMAGSGSYQLTDSDVTCVGLLCLVKGARDREGERERERSYQIGEK